MPTGNFKSVLGSGVWDWSFRLIAAISLVGGAISYASYNNLAQCQAEYNEINNRRTRILTEATNQEREAERRTDDAQAALFLSPITTISVSKRTAAEKAELLKLFVQFQESLRVQIEERHEADLARSLNPVPPPPSELCG
jgi:hypothetical protein